MRVRRVLMRSLSMLALAVGIIGTAASVPAPVEQPWARATPAGAKTGAAEAIT